MFISGIVQISFDAQHIAVQPLPHCAKPEMIHRAVHRIRPISRFIAGIPCLGDRGLPVGQHVPPRWIRILLQDAVRSVHIPISAQHRQQKLCPDIPCIQVIVICHHCIVETRRALLRKRFWIQPVCQSQRVGRLQPAVNRAIFIDIVFLPCSPILIVNLLIR